MSREQSRRVGRLEAQLHIDREPAGVLAGMPLSDEEIATMLDNWRWLLAAGGGVASDGTSYKAGMVGSALYLMPRPMTEAEWLASVAP